MTVKIFIRRHCQEGQVEKALEMLIGFRRAAMDQPGYLAGETLVNHYDSRSILVVSIWESVDDWIRWQNSALRDRNEARIEELLDRPTVYEIFDLRASSG